MRILCATDLLATSDPAVKRAGMLAEELVAELSVLHVVSPSAAPCAVQGEIDQASASPSERTEPPAWGHRAPDVIVKASAQPSRIIVDEARARRAGLVVIGAQPSWGAADLRKGTVAERVLRTREFATLIVRGNPRHEYRNVVLALDLSETSASVIRGLESMGITGAQRCTVVHAYETPYEEMLRSAAVGLNSIDEYLGGWRREHRAAITELLMAESAMPWRYDVVLEEGAAPSVILRYLRKSEADLLVIGTSGGRQLHQALPGSTGAEVLAGTKCDVLVMPHDAPLRARLPNGRPVRESGVRFMRSD
jgi:universal stress protein E